MDKLFGCLLYKKSLVEMEDLFCYQEGAMLSWMDEEDDMLGLTVDSKTLQEWYCSAHVSGHN